MNVQMKWGLKVLAVWIVLLIGQVAGGLLTFHSAPVMPAPHDGPFDVNQAMLIVNGLVALVMAVLAARLRWNGWRKGVTLFFVLFCVQCGLSLIEAVYFNSFLHLSQAMLINQGVTGVIQAALASLMCTFMWRDGSEEAAETFGGLFWKLPVIVPLYIIFYFGAGFLIAWQGEAVRNFYGQGLHIDNGQLAVLQVGRGAIWAGLVLLLTKALTGGKLFRAAMTGLAFAVFMAGPLLFPNPFMPWAVREFHLMEISVSNFLFGNLTALILMVGAKFREKA